MSVSNFPAIPIDTVKAARAVFGRSNFYLVTGDQINYLYDGMSLKNFAKRIQMSTRTLAMLYLITIFQFIETLPDHLAVDALRKRTDWKYALHLPMTSVGFEIDRLCEFRRMLKIEPNSQHILETLLSRLSEITDFDRKARQSFETRQVITAVCQFSRLAKIWGTFNQATEALASKRPDWLLVTSQPHWYARYGLQSSFLNLGAGQAETGVIAEAIGSDGVYLLNAISKSSTPGLADLNEINLLAEVWREQFEFDQGKITWRKEDCAGCSLLSSLPYPMNLAKKDSQEVEIE